MSIINSMLKDLEKRNKQTAEIAYLPITQKKNHSKTPLLLGSGLIFIAVIFFLFSYFFSIDTPKPVLNKLSLSLGDGAKSPLSPPLDDLALQAINISGIEVHDAGNNVVELNFFLDHPTLYHLQLDTIKNELRLSFKQAAFSAELPDLDTHNVAIQTIHYKKSEDNLIFTLKLYPEATLLNADLGGEHTQQLSIRIAAPQSIVEGATPFFKAPALESILQNEFEAAVQAIDNGNHQLAIRKLKKILETDEQFKPARASLAALFIEQGKFVEAKKVLDKGLLLSYDHLPFIELKARLLAISEKYNDALALMQSVAPPINENTEYHALMAELYERTNNDLIAIKLYKQLLSMNPQNGNWWFGLALSLDKIGQLSAAKDTYVKAMLTGRLPVEAATYIQKRLVTLRETSNAAR